MIKADHLKAVDKLKDLTPDQMAAIVALSGNLENEAFDMTNKTSKAYTTFKPLFDEQAKTIHGGYDKDLKEITGIEKPFGKKTYEHLKEILGDAWKAKKEIEPLTKKIATLEEQIKGGKIDETLKAKYESDISDLNDQIKALKEAGGTSKADYEKQIGELQSQIKTSNLNSSLAKIEADLTFTDTVSDNLKMMAINNARTAMAAITEETIENGGDKMVVLRNADGKILRDSKAEPFTKAGYYTSLLSDIIDIKKTTTGGGGKIAPAGSGGSGDKLLDLSGAKSQMQVSELTTAFILKKGISKRDPAFGEMQKEIINENFGEGGAKLTELPMREPTTTT